MIHISVVKGNNVLSQFYRIKSQRLPSFQPGGTNDITISFVVQEARND